MVKIILILIFLFQGLHAFLNTENNYEKQLSVLKNFDIPNNFLKDSIFISMKEDVETYKTKHFLQVLENGDKFVPVLQQMMKDGGVPPEFLYLAMTESSFNPFSSSSTKASGLWQFIPETAKLYRLVNNTYVDERRDPIKSTEAAVKYLNHLHDMFGKWYVAALAYNCGEGTVTKAIAKAGTDDINVLLDESKKYLPKESRLYIRKILMMSFISNSTDFMLDNESEYLLNRANNATFTKVEVKSGTMIKDVAQSIGISFNELKSYNPHIKRAFVSPLGESNYLYIPQDRQVAFTQNFDNTKNSEKYAVYKTKKGDSLQSVAKAYGVSDKTIIELNALSSTALKPQTELVLPIGAKTPSVTPSTQSQMYTIKMGDTMDIISKKHNIPVAQLMKVNNKKDKFVKVGESIVIPKN